MHQTAGDVRPRPPNDLPHKLSQVQQLLVSGQGGTLGSQRLFLRLQRLDFALGLRHLSAQPTKLTFQSRKLSLELSLALTCGGEGVGIEAGGDFLHLSLYLVALRGQLSTLYPQRFSLLAAFRQSRSDSGVLQIATMMFLVLVERCPSFGQTLIQVRIGGQGLLDIGQRCFQRANSVALCFQFLLKANSLTCFLGQALILATRVSQFGQLTFQVGNFVVALS